MRYLALDFEATTCKFPNGNSDFNPSNPQNFLVSAGWAWVDTDAKTVSEVEYVFFKHNISPIPSSVAANNLARLKQAVSECEGLIAHNIKYELKWLLALDIDITKFHPHDTMLRQFVLNKSEISPLNLDFLSKKYGGEEKKADLVKPYLAEGKTFADIPVEIVTEYGIADILSMVDVYFAQSELFKLPENKSLAKTVRLTNEYARVLARMEYSGIKIDIPQLDAVRAEYAKEAESLKVRLYQISKEVMGDRPYNLGSPEDLSQVIYSKQLRDKNVWRDVFNIFKDDRGKPLRRQKMSNSEFQKAVADHTFPVYKETAHKCDSCNGNGRIHKVKKDGSLYAKATLCKVCEGSGLTYVKTTAPAGFRFSPIDFKSPTIGGFQTDKVALELLLISAKNNQNHLAAEFLSKVIRLNAVEMYLSTFVEGIAGHLDPSDNTLHAVFNQYRAQTGRLSGSEPNLQNQPREATFPIRRVFTSRWADIGGRLVDTDFSQLEFRAAAHLSKCQKAISDILAGLDIHAQTAKVLTEAGQPTIRQEAKSRTFRPLYGGMAGTEAEQTYNKAFLTTLYPGIGEWHKQLNETALATKCVTLPTGRQFVFKDIQRTYWGNSNYHTRVVNYPVQAFATADIVPLALWWLDKKILELTKHSKLVLTVHDSVTVDAHPSEIDIVIQIVKSIPEHLANEIKRYYGIDMLVPLATETKVGINLLDMEKV